MVGFLRRRREETDRPVVPWEGGGVRAEVALLPAGRRRAVPAVVLTVGDVRVQLHVGEVRDLVRGRVGIAESVAAPLAFLCRPGAAAAGSPVHEAVGHLPGGALALVVATDRPAVVAVLDGALLDSFTDWARDLPG